MKFFQHRLTNDYQTELVFGITGLTDDFKLCDKYLKHKKIKVSPKQYLRGF